jgi:hypothetical protein
MMLDYRAYILNIDGHRFLKSSRFPSEFPDDTAALEAARCLVAGYEIEVWQHARMVARFDQRLQATTVDRQEVASLQMVAGQPLVPMFDFKSKERA